MMIRPMFKWFYPNVQRVLGPELEAQAGSGFILRACSWKYEVGNEVNKYIFLFISLTVGRRDFFRH